MNLRNAKFKHWSLFVSAVMILVLSTACGSAPSVASQTTVLQARSVPPSINESTSAQSLAAPAVEAAGESTVVEQPALETASAGDSAIAAAAVDQPSAKLAAPAPQDAPAGNPPAGDPLAGDPLVAASQEQPVAAASDAAAVQATSTEPTVGSFAPDFTLQTLDGGSINLSGLRGQNVLINYWVTWCEPCLEEMPALEKIHQEYQGKNLVILSVNGIAQDDLQKVQDTVSGLGLTYPVVLDEADTIFKSYWLGFMPTSVFIDAQGVIRFIKFGGADETEFRAKIDQLLAGTL